MAILPLSDGIGCGFHLQFNPTMSICALCNDRILSNQFSATEVVDVTVVSMILPQKEIDCAQAIFETCFSGSLFWAVRLRLLI